MPYCVGACGTAPRPQTGPRDRVVTGHTGRPLSCVCVCAASLPSSLVSLSSSSSSFSSTSSSCFFFFLTRKERTSVFTDLVLQAYFLLSQTSDDNNYNIFVLAASSSSSICLPSLSLFFFSSQLLSFACKSKLQKCARSYFAIVEVVCLFICDSSSCLCSKTSFLVLVGTLSFLWGFAMIRSFSRGFSFLFCNLLCSLRL
jgi:hypothetical protein